MNAPIPFKAELPPIRRILDAATLILFSGPLWEMAAVMAASRGACEASRKMLKLGGAGAEASRGALLRTGRSAVADGV